MKRKGNEYNGFYGSSLLSETVHNVQDAFFPKLISAHVPDAASIGVCLWRERMRKWGGGISGRTQRAILNFFSSPIVFSLSTKVRFCTLLIFFSPLFPPNCGVAKGRIAFPDMNAQWFSPQKKRKKKKKGGEWGSSSGTHKTTTYRGSVVIFHAARRIQYMGVSILLKEGDLTKKKE